MDNLKHVNDALGHAAGDRLLRGVAETLRSQLRSSDILARLGGDEFVALLPAVGEQEAVAAAEHLLASVRANVIRHAGQEFHATLSIGVGVITGADNQEALLVKADRAMYRAKELGRDQVVSYDAVEPERAGGPAKT